MEHPSSSKNQTDQSKNSYESENVTYVEHVYVGDDGTKELLALRNIAFEADQRQADVEKFTAEQITVGNDQRGETLELRRAHP